MKAYRVAIIAVLSAAVVASLGCGFIEDHFRYHGDKIVTKTIDVSDVETVEIQLGSADIKIVSGTGTDADFEIKKIYRASKKKYIDELLAESRITFEKQGSKLIVRQEGEHGRAFDTLARGYVRIQITATLPQLPLRISSGSGDVRIDDRQAPVSIVTGSGDAIVGAVDGGFKWRSGSGDIKLSDARGDVILSTGSGDMTLASIEGKLETSSGSGDISIERIEGDFTITTGSGDIWVGESIGNAHVKTSSGDVVLDSHTGPADISTTSGDVRVGTYPTANEVALRSSSGNVDVILYGGSVALDITTSSGSITTRVPIVVKEASRRRLIGIAEDGLLKLRIVTSSGDVDVRQGAV